MKKGITPIKASTAEHPPSNVPIRMFFSQGSRINPDVMFQPMNGNGTFAVVRADDPTKRVIRKPVTVKLTRYGFRLTEFDKSEMRPLSQGFWTWKPLEGEKTT